MSVSVTENSGAWVNDGDNEVSKTEGFIGLIKVDNRLEFEAGAGVRNDDFNGLNSVLVATSAGVGVNRRVDSAQFVDDNAINQEADGVVDIDGVNPVSIELNREEAMRRQAGDLSGHGGAQSHSVDTTNNRLTVAVLNLDAGLGIRRVGPLGGFSSEGRFGVQFAEENSSGVLTQFSGDFEVTDTPSWEFSFSSTSLDTFDGQGESLRGEGNVHAETSSSVDFLGISAKGFQGQVRVVDKVR